MLSFTSAQWSAWLAAFIFPLARILAAVASTPILGNKEVPLQVRIGLSVLLTVLVAPTLQMPSDIDPASLQGLLILLEQILAGVVMGFAMRIIFAAAEMAGEVAGLQMGLGFASFYDPQNASFQPILAQFLGVIVSLAFLAMDGHLMVLAAISDSFQSFPVSAVMPSALGLHTLVSWAGSIFADALQISLPLLAALMMTNLALGILTRSAPQLNLFAVGFPITLGMGFLVLALSMPYFRPLIEHFSHAGLTAMQRVVQQLAR